MAPREGEPGWEAARELKMSSSSLAKADLRLPGGREEVTVAVEAIVGDEDTVVLLFGSCVFEDRPRAGKVGRLNGWCGDMNGIQSQKLMIRPRNENRGIQK